MKFDPLATLRDLAEHVRQRKQGRAHAIDAHITETAYYHERSVVYATAQMVILMVLAVFLAVSVLTGRDRLSMENFSLLVSDISSVAILPEAGSSESVTFAADDGNAYVAYRGGLAVLGHERLTVFTATGRENQSVAVSYTHPRLLSSGKYLLIYDHGGKELAVYNSFAKLFDTVSSSPIRSVAVSRAGHFCLINDGESLASTVTVYDGDFEMISRIHLREHAVISAIDDVGEQMCVASVHSQGGRMQLSLMLTVIGEQQPQATLTVADAYPVALTYTNEGILLLCEDRLMVVSRDGAPVTEYTFDPSALKNSRLTEYGCVLMLRENPYNSDTRLIALGTQGELLLDTVLPYDVLDAVTDEDGDVFALGENCLTRCVATAVGESVSMELRERYTSLLPLGDGEVWLCGRARAVCVRVTP